MKFGRLDVPDELLDPAHARHLLGDYLSRDEHGHLYSGAAFDTYPDPLQPSPPDVITNSDLVALTLLGIRRTPTIPRPRFTPPPARARPRGWPARSREGS